MDQTEFERFFKDNETLIYRIVKRYVRSPDTAKEIVLETMLKIYDKWETVRGFESKTGYAVRIAINAAKKHLMGNKFKALFLPQDELEEAPSSTKNPEEVYLAKEKSQHFEAELNALKEIEQTIIFLRDGEDKQFEEIAKVLEMNLSTVKSLYRRAVIKLSQKMEASYGK